MAGPGRSVGGLDGADSILSKENKIVPCKKHNDDLHSSVSILIDDICFCAAAHRHENPDNIGFDTPFYAVAVFHGY